MTHLMAAVAYSEGKRAASITLDQGHEWANKPGHFVWIGIHDPIPQDLDVLKKEFNLHPLAMEDALTQHTRPKLETFGDDLFIVVYMPVLRHDKLQFVETQLFAGKGYVISARYGDSPSYTRVRERSEAQPKMLEHGEDYVLYALLSFIIENYRPILDQIRCALDDMEAQILEEPLTPDKVQQIQSLRRDLLQLRRYASPLAEICSGLQQLEFPFIDKHMRPYFKDLSIHVTRLLEDIVTQREIADHAMDLGLLLDSARQSLVQRKFAAWAAILAIPTAVTGTYGMNFDVIPGLKDPYGFYITIGAIAVVCGALYLNFKRLKWL